MTVEGPSSLDLARRHAEQAQIRPANPVSEIDREMASMWALVSIAKSLEEIADLLDAQDQPDRRR